MIFRKAVLSLVSMNHVFMNRANRRKLVAIKRQVDSYCRRADRKYGYAPGTMFQRVTVTAFPETAK